MHLTLFIPDLLWPEVDDSAAFEFSGASALARLLFFAKASRTELTPTDSWESRLAVLFGFPENPGTPPLAALRSLGDGLASSGLQLCTDPVNLDFMQQALVLSPIPADTLSDADTTALLQTLNEEFADEGHFVATHRHHPSAQTGTRWTYMPTAGQSALPDLAACSRLAGRRVDADETRRLLGRDGLRWINRIQMCLNQHPVNLVRETQGLPLINSLWPWGLGELMPGTRPANRFTGMYNSGGQTGIIAGLCQVTQTPCDNRRGVPDTPGHYLVTECRLAEAISQNDLDCWQNTISTVASEWIAPALAALSDRTHPLASLTLISPNAHHEHRWTLTASSKGLRASLLQRCLGRSPESPSLSALVRTWSN